MLIRSCGSYETHGYRQLHGRIAEIASRSFALTRDTIYSFDRRADSQTVSSTQIFASLERYAFPRHLSAVRAW